MGKVVGNGVTGDDQFVVASPFTEELNRCGPASRIEREQIPFLANLCGLAYGHDNAARVRETGHELELDHDEWRDVELAATVGAMLTGKAMQRRLAAKSAHMRPRHETTKAATIMSGLFG